MNVTELARRLKMTTNDLLEVLPQLGVDIGKKAIKIDETTANRIIANWAAYRKKLEYLKMQGAEQSEGTAAEGVEKKVVTVPAAITVRDFATLADLNVSAVLAQLMKNGIFISMNERIDAETAMIIGEDLHLEVKVQTAEDTSHPNTDKVQEVLAAQGKETLVERPPVIVVMGHVDHGKTKLLDAIRHTNVVAGESGGITQHIGAYQIEHKGKAMTFIDTPGHEVFTAMRSRGAKVADIAILVVAADDGVKPQTVEAYRIIEQAKIPFIVAINKVDKPGTDIDRTKGDLSSKLKVVSEDWGGKTICVPVSALKGEGIENVLDALVLLGEMDADKIVANPATSAIGTVIEAHLDKGEGSVATVLIQNGTLRVGDILVVGEQVLGKIRVMKHSSGADVINATPSMPVRIAGLKLTPAVGDIVEAVGDDKRIRLSKMKRNVRQSGSLQNTAHNDETGAKINVIIRSDVFGSAEAIEEALEKLNTKDVRVKIIKKGLGAVTESDVDQALATNAMVIGFHVHTPQSVDLLAREKGVEIKHYTIVYELVDFIKSRMQEALGTQIIRTDLGVLKVLAVFKSENKAQIIGGAVSGGFVEVGAKAYVLRGEDFITDGTIETLQSGKIDVTRVETGQECGIRFAGTPLIKAGDILKVYKEEEIKKTL